MKFCYVDESIQGGDITVVAGVLVDAGRMHRTKIDWDELLDSLRSQSQFGLPELKGRELYRGQNFWRQWDGGERTILINTLINWMAERKHKVTFGAVSKDRLQGTRGEFDLDGFQQSTEWSIAAMHLLLGIQKTCQIQKNNKGKTVFVFDEASGGKSLVQLVLHPPAATDGFYSRAKATMQLDQVVDVPYFADSRHVGLIQLADLLAYLLCLFAALAEGIVDEAYDGEREKLTGWISQMRPVLLRDSSRWPKSSRDPCTTFFRNVAPPSLLGICS